MPLAQRSAIPTVPGVSAAVAVAIAVGCTFIGYLIDSARGAELTRAFSTLYFLGCVSAALIVRYRGLFTTVVQPPLILFLAVPLAYYNLKDSGTSMRDIALNVAYPLVDRFPLMAATTVIVLLIGLARFVLAHQHRRAPTAARVRSQARSPRAAAQRPTRQRAASQRPVPQQQRASARRKNENPAEPRTRRQAAAPLAEETRYRRQSGTPSVDPRPTRRARHEAPEPEDRTYRRGLDGQDRPSRRAGGNTESVYRYADEYRPAPQPSRRSSERRYRPDYPSHPLPQVRYREREEPPYTR